MLKDADDRTVTFVESRSKVLKLVAISAGFAVIGGLFVWTGGPESGRGSGPVAMVAMGAGLAMGLVGLVCFVPRLFGAPRVLLVIDDSGFQDRASLMAAGRVEWSEVIELSLVSISGNDNIAARVTDPDRIQRGRGPMGRLVAGMNRRSADVWIAGQTFRVPARDVLDQMLDRWNRSCGGRDIRESGGA